MSVLHNVTVLWGVLILKKYIWVLKAAESEQESELPIFQINDDYIITMETILSNE